MMINRIIIKNLTVGCLCCFLLIPFTNSQAQNNDKVVRLGLVLSGGGAKGLAHIGVLKMIEEEHIPISLIAGNSIGAVLGALYSVGYSAKDIEEFTKKQDWDKLLSDDVERRYKPRFKQNYEHKYLLKLDFDSEKRRLTFPSGLVKGNNIFNFFCGATAAIPDSIDFNQLPIPFACIAYNLETGSEVILNKGYLPKAMLASMAIPGFFSPVKYNGMKLVDGGVINNFPVDVAKEMGADITIGVHLKQQHDHISDYLSIGSVFMRIVKNIDVEKHMHNTELADIVINPDLDGVSILDFREEFIDCIIEKGYLAAKEQLPRIKALIEDLHIQRNNNVVKKVNNRWFITDIDIPEAMNRSSKFIMTHLNIEENTSYTTDEIEKATRELYAYGNFEMVSFKLMPNEEGYTLELMIEDKKERQVMLGVSLNSVDVAAFYINSSLQSHSNIINRLSSDIKIAVNPQLRMIMETNRLFFSTVGLSLNARYSQMNYYNQHGGKESKMDMGSITADLYANHRWRDIGDVGFGIKHSYFNATRYTSDADPLFKSNYRAPFTALYSYLTIDSRDDLYLPGHGSYLSASVSLLAPEGEFSAMIPLFELSTMSLISVGDRLSMLFNLHHRSICKANDYPVSFSNYASNMYNAYTRFYFPVLGQRGVRVLAPVATLGELGARVQLPHHHYVTPRVQVLFQCDQWAHIGLSKLEWSAGLTYQTHSKAGPIDFTLGFRETLKEFNLYGGVGYQF